MAAAAAATGTCLAVVRDVRLPSLPLGIGVKSSAHAFNSSSHALLCCKHSNKQRFIVGKRHIAIQAAYRGRDVGSSHASVFVGGFILGGLIVGTLGCVLAPQISRAIAGADKKELMRKLPKFIYNEERDLEKKRKILAEKITKLNSAIDEVSSQLHGDGSNGAAGIIEEIEMTA